MTVQSVSPRTLVGVAAAAGAQVRRAGHDSGLVAPQEDHADSQIRHLLNDPHAVHLPNGVAPEPEALPEWHVHGPPGESFAVLYAHLTGALPGPSMATYSAAMAGKLHSMIFTVQSNIVNDDA